MVAMLGAMDPGTIVMFLSPVIPVVLDRNVIANPLNKIMTKVGPSVLVIMVASIALPHIVGDMIGGTAISTLTKLHELLTTSGADEKNGNDKAVVDSNTTKSGEPKLDKVTAREVTVSEASKPSRVTETSSMPGVAVDNEVDN